MDSSRKHTVSSHFARAHLENATRLGMDAQAILDFSGIPRALIEEPHARLSPQQLARLYIKIMLNHDDEYVGLSTEQCRFGIFSLMAERLVQFGTLREVLTEAQRFYDLTNNSVDLLIEYKDDLAHLSIVVDQPPSTHYYLLPELLMLIWHRFPSWLIGETIPLQEVHFSYANPLNDAEYQLLFPFPQHFESASNTLIFPASILDKPIQRTSVQLQRYLSQVPLQWFRKSQFTEFYTEKVIQILEAATFSHQITLEQAAQQLNMSSRTLRRRLTDEGSMFQQLKDELQRDQSIYMLSQNNLTINEVAMKIGYSEPASFIRAFKNWTGASPGQYRKQLSKPKL